MNLDSSACLLTWRAGQKRAAVMWWQIRFLFRCSLPSLTFLEGSMCQRSAVGQDIPQQSLVSTVSTCSTCPAPLLRGRNDRMRVTKMSGKGVLFTHQSPARTYTKLTLHTKLRGVFSKGGNTHMRTLNNTEWGLGVHRPVTISLPLICYTDIYEYQWKKILFWILKMPVWKFLNQTLFSLIFSITVFFLTLYRLHILYVP